MAETDQLSAVLLNCSLKSDSTESHTRRLLERIQGIMKAEGVDVELIHMLDHHVAFGMVMDATENGAAVDDWPAIQAKIMDADIFVIGSPIWLGMKSSVATLAVERLYAYSAETNDKGQYLYYGKTAGCVITGNEDGVKACSMDILYAMQHIGFAVPPQADCGWLGDIGPGPSYGDEVEGQDSPAGYDSEFTNKNATYMTWNLMHMATMLKANGGIPAKGNTADSWQQVSNATQFEPTS